MRQGLNTQISETQIEFYRANGYVVIEGLLDDAELGVWRETLADEHLPLIYTK